MSKSLPAFSNFLMAGQWVEIAGGLPPTAFSGRHAEQIPCKRDGKRFQSKRRLDSLPRFPTSKP
jgi:hypothetical protein